MAAYSFRLPDIGEGIAETEIMAWYVIVGDVVEEGQPIADVMTDKASVEMTAPVSGRVTSLGGAVGDIMPIGSVLISFDTADDAPVARPDHTPEVPEVTSSSSVPPMTARASSQQSLASPAVRARARALGIDLATIRPTEGGRVRHADLDALMCHERGDPGHPLALESDIVDTIKIVGMRRQIARKMAESKQHIPHFSYVEECDVTALDQLRRAMNAMRGDRPKLSLLPFLIRAIVQVVPEFPMVNAHHDDEGGMLTRYHAVHLGLAVQSGEGLMVPVIRDAGSHDVWSLASEALRVAQGARAGTLAATELSGSTITLTSLGALGGIASTPIINRPEVAIVGVNRMVERAAVIEGRIEVRRMMNLSSSFDHRIVDGYDAARFIQAIRRLLETPALLFQ